MRFLKVGWSLTALAGALFLIGSGPAGAVEPEEEGQLLLNSEFMIMKSFGTGLNTFELKIEDDDGSSINRGHELEGDSDFGWRGDLQYKKGAWGAGISGFHFDDEADEQILQQGETGTQDEVSLRTGATSFDCNFDGSGEYCFGEADGQQKFWMVDLYGIREIVGTPDVTVDLQFGLRIAEYEWDVDILSAIVEPVGASLVIGDENPVRINSSSDTDDALVGPFLSLMSTGRFGRFRVDGQLSQAVVFGELDQSVVANQYEDEAGTISSLVFEEAAVLGRSQDAVIPITDIRIKLGYDILDALTLGFGAYATTWFNVPVPPNTRATDRGLGISAIQGDEENITLLGASFSLEYRFGGGSLPDLSSLMP